jgi:hypothetical protein
MRKLKTYGEPMGETKNPGTHAHKGGKENFSRFQPLTPSRFHPQNIQWFHSQTIAGRMFPVLRKEEN